MIINKEHTNLMFSNARSLCSVILIAVLSLSALSVFADNLDEAKYALRIKDYDKAVELLRSLANESDADGQYQLASLYRSGLGVKKNHKKAVYWLKKAAEQKHIKAQYNLGVRF